jgi:hypothetical protein
VTRTAATSWRTYRVLAALLMAALLAGCASMVPQTMALRTDWPAGVPERAELAQVPFFPQDDYQCGPAALATVLVATGAQATPQALVPQVWLPSRHGSLQLEMLSTPRRYARVSYRLGPRFADLLREVAAGNPVIVLQDVGLMLTQWHYAVVNGFDYSTGSIFLRSGTDARKEMPFTYFERTWMKGGYWAMVLTPPDRIPATATPERWIEALIAFSRSADAASVTRAYATAHRKWPDNLPAAIGLANQLHTAGQLGRASQVLADALARDPQSVIVRNNLAQTLSDQGRNREALEVIEPAMADAQSPFAAEVRATRQLIVDRMQPKAAAR